MTPCIEWQGTRTTAGYGTMKVDGKMRYIHRMVMADAGHDIEGKVIMHLCDNPPCHNVEHLRVGTQKDNMADAAAKGRIRNQNTGKTHCGKGHEYTPENTYSYEGSTRRHCKTCVMENQRKRRAKLKESPLVG